MKSKFVEVSPGVYRDPDLIVIAASSGEPLRYKKAIK